LRGEIDKLLEESETKSEPDNEQNQSTPKPTPLASEKMYPESKKDPHFKPFDPTRYKSNKQQRGD